MICRTILSHIAVDKGAKAGDTFKAYVEYLATNGYIPPNGKGWVDYIRQLGNTATHEIVIVSSSDAANALTFTEQLLRNVYELPGMVPT